MLAAQSTPGHPLELLKIIANSDGGNAAVRQAAAVRFKNVIAKGWDTQREDGNDQIVITPEERTMIKTHLVQLMCTTPPQIQSQLSESISLVAEVDYPANWNNLLGELVQQLNTTNPVIRNGVLMTADSIFGRFVNVGRSDELYRVIAYTLEGFQAPLLALLKALGQAVDAASNDASALKSHLESLRLLVKIYYSLNYQDLPEFFEDHMDEVMMEFRKYLQFNNPIVVDPNEENEPSPIDKLQAGIIDVLDLYASKDEEPFMTFLPDFSAMIWNLLTSVSSLPKHDNLATTSINFLSLLVERDMHKHLFQEDSTLRQIVLKIVIPNLSFRDCDEERFEDNPQDYMVTEVDGSDSESRRWSSEVLLRAMCRKFEAQTTVICGEHINQMLVDYSRDPERHWAMKDTAIQMMMGISIVRDSPLSGVTEVSKGVNLLDFFQNHVLPELRDGNHQSRPVVKATSLKFVSKFRNQFTTEQLVQLIPIVVTHLSSPVVVVHTFAAYTLERMFFTKEFPESLTVSKPKLQSAAIREFLDPIFAGLFSIVESAEHNENEYGMKCVMRALATAGQDVVPVTELVMNKLTAVLIRVAPNPRNPQFNHYLFESIAVLVKNVCLINPEATGAFEPLLFPPFNDILRLQVAEFTPYVFQILAQLLEFRPTNAGLGDAYTQLFHPILKPPLWEVRGNVPALARLLKAYISLASNELVSHLTPILGISQKLLASKITETSAFDILDSVVLYFARDAFIPFLKPLMQLLLQRLQAGKTPRYIKLVTSFFALVVGKLGAETFLDCMNSMQPGLAIMILQQVWIPRMKADPPKVFIETKVQAIGLTRIICDTTALIADPKGHETWVSALVVLVNLFSSTTHFGRGSDKDYSPDDAKDIEIGYDSVYSRLVFATKKSEDPFSDISNPAELFVKSLHAMIMQRRDEVLALIQHTISIEPKLSSGLELLFQQSGLSLAG